MKKVLMMIIILASLLVTGCSYDAIAKHDYTYRGENENWIGEYKEHNIVTFPKRGGESYCDSKEKSVLILTNKNSLSRLPKVKNIEIFYDNGMGLKMSEYHNYDISSKIQKTYRMIGGGGVNIPLNDHLGNPKNVSKCLAIYCSMGQRFNNGESIKVSISLDGKKQTIELMPSKISWQNILKERDFIQGYNIHNIKDKREDRLI